jgi:hypothetical protein
MALAGLILAIRANSVAYKKWKQHTLLPSGMPLVIDSLERLPGLCFGCVRRAFRMLPVERARAPQSPLLARAR